jgi:hypothetical protein
MRRFLCHAVRWLACVQLVHAAHFVQSVHAADARPFPDAGSKKGLQVQMIDDALTLGDGQFRR